MGQRGTKTCDVILDNVRVPAANIIGGKPGQGFKTAMKVLDRGRLHISAVACGMAQRILNESVAYARERKQFGKRIGDFQLVQAMLADSQAELYAGWSMVQDAALRYDAKGAPASATRKSACWPRAASFSAPRWSAASPIVACRCTAAPATSTSTRSSASTATCGCCACTKARRRSSK
jgi:alkylation response protein AidB-like acyl-CoA dehydrogenase